MNIRIGAIWIGLLLVFTAEGVFAQTGLIDIPPGKWWIKRVIIREMSLSTDQQRRIEALWTERTARLMGQQAELKKRQKTLEEMVAKDSVDVSAVMRTFDELQQFRNALERSTFLMRIQIKSLLTPEQQQKLERIAERLRQQKGKIEDLPDAPSPATKKAP